MSSELSLTTVINPLPGWYRGDLHAHTYYSDGTLSPMELVDLIRDEGLDFLAVTDHNTIEAFPHFGAPPDLLLIPGLEFTLREMHFNVFGIRSMPAWAAAIFGSQPLPALGGEYGDASQVMDRLAKQGVLNSLNHPLLHPWACLDGALDLRGLHLVEIWNDPSWPDNREANPAAVAMWSAWLNEGYRITAVGGSDFHRPAPPPEQQKPPERLGLPSTYVYASDLSGRSLLAALEQRRAYVSMGAQVAFQARVGDKRAMIGDDLGQVAGTIYFSGSVDSGGVPATASLVKNGRTLEAISLDGAPAQDLRFADSVDPLSPAWYRLDVHSASGAMLAITNPIFTGPAPNPARHRFGDFVSLA